MKVLLHIPDVVGSSKVPGYERWVECTSVQWGCGRGIGFGVFDETKGEHVRTDERHPSAISVSEITLAKSFDCATAFLVRLSNDKTTRTARVVVLDDTAKPMLEYRLHETLVSGFSNTIDSQTASRMGESLSLNFTRLDLVSHVVPEGAEPMTVTLDLRPTQTE